MNKKFFVLIITVICLLAGILSGWLYFRYSIFSYADKDVYIRTLKNHVRKTYGSKYELYAALWNENDAIPRFTDYDKKRILWLGGNIEQQKGIDLNALEKYGLILTTDKPMLIYLKLANENFNVQVLPVFTEPQGLKSVANKDKFTAVIGYPPFAFDFLKIIGEKYKHYMPDDVYRLREDLPYFKAIIGYPTTLLSFGATLHPIIMLAAAHGVPAIGYYQNSAYDALPMLSNYAKYYRSIEELAIAWKEAFRDRQRLKDYVLNNFTKEKIIQRFDEIINEQKTFSDEVHVDITTAVGDYNSGDYWLALDLVDALHRRGYNANIVCGDVLYKPSPKVNIIMRGTLNDVKYNLNGQINILYLAWSNLKVNGEEQQEPLEDYIEQISKIATKVDYLVVSSPRVVAALQKKGIKAEYIPEFTNVRKFYYDFRPEKQTEMLFVGNYHFKREGPLHAVLKNLPISIYGSGWPLNIPIKGTYIDNRILRQFYSSAKIVLNDTKPNMRDFGFITTRLYDATASGAFVISDYIPEIAETYGDNVPMWHNADELEYLTRYYLEHEDERKAKAEKAQKITLENFTSDKVAESFDKIIKKITSQIQK